MQASCNLEFYVTCRGVTVPEKVSDLSHGASAPHSVLYEPHGRPVALSSLSSMPIFRGLRCVVA